MFVQEQLSETFAGLRIHAIKLYKVVFCLNVVFLHTLIYDYKKIIKQKKTKILVTVCKVSLLHLKIIMTSNQIF